MEDNKNAYSEVIEILKLVDDEKKLEALPMEMLEVLKAKSNPEYKPYISKEIPLDEQNLQPETFSILSWITNKYWSDEINDSDNTNIKNEVDINAKTLKIEDLKENSINAATDENIEIKAKFDENDVNTETESTIESNDIKETSNMPILYKDLKWYEKIKIKIVEFFNRIFRREKHEIKMEN